MTSISHQTRTSSGLLLWLHMSLLIRFVNCSKKSVCESVRKSTEKFGDCLGLCLSSGAGFFSLFCFIIFAFALAYVAESFFYFQCFNCKFFCLCFFCVLVHVS